MFKHCWPARAGLPSQWIRQPLLQQRQRRAHPHDPIVTTAAHTIHKAHTIHTAIPNAHPIYHQSFIKPCQSCAYTSTRTRTCTYAYTCAFVSPTPTRSRTRQRGAVRPGGAAAAPAARWLPQPRSARSGSLMSSTELPVLLLYIHHFDEHPSNPPLLVAAGSLHCRVKTRHRLTAP